MSDSIGSESHTPPLNLENFKMPTLEEIFDNINAMQLSEEEKEKMKENIVSRYEAYMKGVNGQGHAGDAPAAAAAAAAKKFVPFAMDYVLILLWIVLLLVIAFFGYKLYKSLSERERRKEQKARSKQLGKQSKKKK